MPGRTGIATSAVPVASSWNVATGVRGPPKSNVPPWKGKLACVRLESSRPCEGGRPLTMTWKLFVVTPARPRPARRHAVVAHDRVVEHEVERRSGSESGLRGLLRVDAVLARVDLGVAARQRGRRVVVGAALGHEHVAGRVEAHVDPHAAAFGVA